MNPSTDQRLEAALIAQSRGNLAETEQLCRSVLSDDPKNSIAQILLGIVSFRRGDVDGAVGLFRSVLTDEPDNLDALNWLSNALRRAGRFEEARLAAEQTIRLRPNDPEARFTLGVSLLGLNRFEGAVEALSQAAKLRPNVALTHFHLGFGLLALGRSREALAAFNRSVELAPGTASNHVGQGQAHLALGNHKAAMTSANRALQLDPRQSMAQILLAQSLAAEQRFEEATAHLEKAIEIEPNSADAHSNLGTYLQEIGDFSGSQLHLQKAIELDPYQPSPYFGLAQSRTFQSKDDELIARMEALTRNPEISIKSKGVLHYGLGKAFQDLRDYQAAMWHFDEGNRVTYEMHHRDQPWDRVAHEKAVSRTVADFGAEFLVRSKGAGSDSDLPILIVGMIRSGTTLTEQILSSHPMVGGAGEQNFWFDHIKESLDEKRGGLRPDVARRLAKKYCDLLRSKAPQNAHVTDKMPGNYAMMGPIHAHLPNAKFIHVRRNAADTCLSIWTTYVTNPAEYANDRGNIVFAYKQYLRAMEHWRSVMPKNRLLEIDYEHLVTEPERVIRGMLEFCGLPWDEARLRHEENVRSVTTPSLWRVRQPVDRNSVERWRRYEPWLGEFRELLSL